MNIERIYAIFLRSFYLYRRNLTRLSNLFLWSIMDILMWGFISRYLDQSDQSHFSFLTAFLGAIILWNFLIRVQQGIIMVFFEDMWTQNFFNLFASPLRVSEYVMGLVTSGIATSIIALLLMGVLAVSLFAYNITALGLLALPLLAILFVFGMALGIFTAAIVLRLGPSAEWLAWPIPAVIGPFAGIFYPVASLPLFLQPLSKILPPSYAFEAMRTVLAGGALPTGHLLVGLGLAFVYLLAAALFFAYIYRVVLKNGLLTRFSAESL